MWSHDTRMGNLGSNMQGQGSWDGISGMDPAVQVEHVVWHIFGMNAVYWVSYVLPGRNDDAKCEQNNWANAPMKAKYWWIDVNMRDLDQGL